VVHNKQNITQSVITLPNMNQFLHR